MSIHDANEPRLETPLSATGQAAPFYGWRMVALACMCTNIGVALTYGSYSTFIAPMVQDFPVSRTLASSGMSILVVSMGLMGPIIGYGLRRWSIRSALLTGFILMAVGWGLVSMAQSAWQFTLSFGVFCGAAGAFLIVVPPMTLINNWFIAMRGRANGIIMLAFLMSVLPPVLAASIVAHGWRATAMYLAIVSLVLAPVTLLVIDRPESIGQKPLGADLMGDNNQTIAASSLDESGSPIRDPIFWVVMIGFDIFGAIGVGMTTHFIPILLEAGMSLKPASVLLSIFGFAQLGGALLGGYLADRLGGSRAFVVTSVIAGMTWPCLLFAHQFWLLAVCMVVFGACSNSIMPIAGTVFANLFGRIRFAQVIGLMTVMTMPFNFTLPLLSGVIYDFSGSYRMVFVLNAVLFALVAVAFAFAHKVEARRVRARLASGLQ